MRNQIEEWGKFISNLKKRHPGMYLERRIIASGATQITAFTQTGKFIQHISQKIMPSHLIDNLPIAQDFRNNNPPCIRCGRNGTELHHWAPQHLFDDAWEWPTNYLCKECHELWHRRIKEHR